MRIFVLGKNTFILFYLLNIKILYLIVYTSENLIYLLYLNINIGILFFNLIHTNFFSQWQDFIFVME